MLKDNISDVFSDYFCKIDKDGFTWCCFCKYEIEYGSGSVRCWTTPTDLKLTNEIKVSLDLTIVSQLQYRQHALRSQVLQILIASLCLVPVQLLHPHYLMVAAPNIEQEQNRSRIDLEVASVPKPVSFKDRISHQESLNCSFLAEHTMPLSSNS